MWFVWHSRNMAKQGETPCLNSSWKMWLLCFPSHIIIPHTVVPYKNTRQNLYNTTTLYYTTYHLKWNGIKIELNTYILPTPSYVRMSLGRVSTSFCTNFVWAICRFSCSIWKSEIFSCCVVDTILACSCWKAYINNGRVFYSTQFNTGRYPAILFTNRVKKSGQFFYPVGKKMERLGIRLGLVLGTGS